LKTVSWQVEAVIFVGIQATGKSTFYRQRFIRTHIRLSLDMLRTRHRESLLLKACLEAKQPFVIDNTNPTIEERAHYIELAKASRFRVTGYYFQSALEDSIRRNAQRSGAEHIPEVGIRGTYRRLELPSVAEGFDALYYVKIEGDSTFNVGAWQNEL
jgi:predicted kinase